MRIECERSDGTATVGVVSESGLLEPDVAKRAFERFYRGAGNRRSGTGWGCRSSLPSRSAGGGASLEGVDGGHVRAEVSLPSSGLSDS